MSYSRDTQRSQKQTLSFIQDTSNYQSSYTSVDEFCPVAIVTSPCYCHTGKLYPHKIHLYNLIWDARQLPWILDWTKIYTTWLGNPRTSDVTTIKYFYNNPSQAYKKLSLTARNVIVHSNFNTGSSGLSNLSWFDLLWFDLNMFYKSVVQCMP